MTNGRFQVSEFNDSFPAMNLKSGRSPGDPNWPFALLLTGQSVKARFCKVELYKAAIGNISQRSL
ncbi:hypothetical protein A1353_19815 [Methylomonas methanica]|uniref:Uncharacterized protein n=1 Tax=Methylomonas methanica TaxID=421 RepID=A0A177M5A7_METMH|nr:hypothetical protein A1353_19815 [Methylomonas methanica]